jgi:hypothetical protein
MSPTTTENLIVLRGLEGNAPTSLTPVQKFLAPHIDALTLFWVLVWFVTAIVVLIQLWREYRAHRK